MGAPPITAELLARIEQADAAVWRASDLPANDGMVLVEQFGNAWAFITPSQPNTLFNRCIGLGEDDAEKVSFIDHFFRAHDIPPRFDVCPDRSGPALRAALAKIGCRPEALPGFSRRFSVARPMNSPITESQNQFVVRCIDDPEHLDHFLSIQATVWPEDGPRTAARLRRLHASHGDPSLRRYLAWIDDTPVATAAMGLHSGIAFLFAGAVLATYRRCGIQTALIARRLCEAAAAGADCAAALTTPGTASERNLHRFGFVTACDRELWLPPRWADSPFYRLSS